MAVQGEEKIALGKTDVQVSPIGVGTNSWGGKGEADPGKRATFEALLEAGITLFDTAEIYTGGASERTIGGCITAAGRMPVVLTKFFPLPWRLGRGALVSALQRSLERLKLPRVDVYLLHFPLPPVPLVTWANALADAVESGLTRSVGISNCSADQTRQVHAVLAARGVPLACNEVEFSLLHRAPEKNGLLQTCKELGVTLIAYRPLAQGSLSGKYSPEHPPGGVRSLLVSKRKLAAIQPLILVMRGIAEKHGKTLPQVAVNWTLCKGSLPIPGAKNPRQALENAGALGWRLSPHEVAELEAACP